jgi:hypothetical protein
MLRRRYFTPEPSKAEANFAFALESITSSIACGRWQVAQHIANEWGHDVSRSLGLPQQNVWKAFKRQLAAVWFEPPQRRVFLPEWSAADALAYARQFPDRNVRISSFPQDIACHAKSVRLPADEKDHWLATVASLDRRVLIEVFPESSSDTGICFRRFTSAFGEDVFYEAGMGQAMAVFEEEQGKHPTVFASKKCPMRFSIRGQGPGPEITKIKRRLRLLIRKHDTSIQSRCSAICRRIGIDELGLEGYFNPNTENDLVVVDFDLPLDFVFM